MKFREFIQEQKEKHAVLAFGRMNPPTTGHAKLVDKVKDVAKSVGGSHHVVLSHSQDPKKTNSNTQNGSFLTLICQHPAKNIQLS